MTIATTNTKVHISSLVSLRLVYMIENAIAAFTQWNAERKTVKTLHKLSNHELADIGLDRASISTVFKK